MKKTQLNNETGSLYSTKSPKTELLERIQALKEHFEGLAKKACPKNSEKKLEGSLRIANGNHGPQFFYITRKGDTKGRYLSVKNPGEMELARSLAQKNYYEKLQSLCEQWLIGLKKVETQVLNLPSETKIFPRQPARRNLVTPLDSEMTYEEYLEKWKAVEYKGKAFAENSVVIKTNRGELVRSKSECLIANKLDSMGIPYRYEYPVSLKVNAVKSVETAEGESLKFQKESTVTVFPDFTVPGLDRREIIIEHFGLMDDPEYAENAVRKMNLYAMNGFFPGENLLVTYETCNCPLDIQIFENEILRFFAK